jgi:hypothetical protein
MEEEEEEYEKKKEDRKRKDGNIKEATNCGKFSHV